MLRLKSSTYGIIFFRTSSWLLHCCGHRCGLWLCVELCFSFSREKLEAEESYATLGPTRALLLQYSLSENCFFIPYATCSTVELCEFTQKLVFCAGDGVACVWHVTVLPFFVVAGFSAVLPVFNISWNFKALKRGITQHGLVNLWFQVYGRWRSCVHSLFLSHSHILSCVQYTHVHLFFS
jgi:hypothetical protein